MEKSTGFFERSPESDLIDFDFQFGKERSCRRVTKNSIEKKAVDERSLLSSVEKDPETLAGIVIFSGDRCQGDWGGTGESSGWEGSGAGSHGMGREGPMA